MTFWKSAKSGLLLLALGMWPVFGVMALEEKDLQQFIDEAIQAGGGEVVIPPGEHVIRKGLKVVNAKGLRIAGMDKERSSLKWEGEIGRSVIEISGTMENVSVGKLTFSGNDKGQSGVHVKTQGGSGLKIEDCLFEKGLERGIQLLGMDAAVIENCSFRDLGKVGIEVGEGSKEPLVMGNWFTRCAIGVHVAKEVKVQLVSNEFLEVSDVTLVEKGGEVMELTAEQVRQKTKTPAEKDSNSPSKES